MEKSMIHDTEENKQDKGADHRGEIGEKVHLPSKAAEVLERKTGLNGISVVEEDARKINNSDNERMTIIGEKEETNLEKKGSTKKKKPMAQMGYAR